jgi:chromosome partitioning protein
MPVVAVVNRKGGSGKSTLATHLAAYAANHGTSVMLADVDRQQSMRTWLRERSAQASSEPRPVISRPAPTSSSSIRRAA